MLLDNETLIKAKSEQEENPYKIHEWIEQYTGHGKFSLVTGYFTVGALAWFAEKTNHFIEEYQLVLGDIVSVGSEKERALDLLNEEINIEAALKLNKNAKNAVRFLEQDKVNAKTLEPNFCHAKLFVFKHFKGGNNKNYYISGSSNLTEAGIALRKSSNVELNLASFGSDPHFAQLAQWADELWECSQAHENKTLKDEKGKTKSVNFKQYLIDEIKKIFYEYSPKELYYKVLFELFGNELLLEKDNPELNRQIGRLENTDIYNALFEFQKKGVLSLIKMLQKFNGAILADAVGLGKTWSALAVMKFYQLQGREIIVFCPKKIQNNWRAYLKNQNSKFENDNFDFFIRFHTDLSENFMEKYLDTADKFFTSEKPKLFVIDESHNLRNDKSKRYNFLIDNILAKNADAKILMLSATPINNSLNDIRNQFKLIVAGNPNGFEESLDIKNLDYTFRNAQTAFNLWAKANEPKISDFIKELPPNFFKLTDSLTVARTRKMIEEHQNGLQFPQKTKPENIFVTPNQIGNFESFEELFEKFPPMLSGYQPSFYLNIAAKTDVMHDEKQRDRFLVQMMYILMVKRLESSWFSFYLTVQKILQHHQNALDKIVKFQSSKKADLWNEDAKMLFDDDEIADKVEDFFLGKKRKTSLQDIADAGNIENYKKDLKADIDALENLERNLKRFAQKNEKELLAANKLRSEDLKLQALMKRIKAKREAGENNGNPKVLIFTVYKDTAFYLFNQLKTRGFDNLAVVSGDESAVWNENEKCKNYENILQRFAPYTKLFREREWLFQPSNPELSAQENFEEWKNWIEQNDPKTRNKIQNPVDILIATDALSEGQNLQDCDLVINYDIHWNPVRVIQRMGRIDRIGSLNKKIFGINFWPSNNINSYLNLQGRIEQKMTAMKLAGSEVNLDFSDSFKEMAEDESLEKKQNEKMLKQMESSWEEINSEQNLGFDDFSLENFRQELLLELRQKEDFYRAMPKGVYTGFWAKTEICTEEGIIALLGYPTKPPKAQNFEYKGYELIYIDKKGNDVLCNQKEVLDALAKHKDNLRYVPKNIDLGEQAVIEELSSAIAAWLKRQVVEEETQEDGSVKNKMGKASLDVLKKIKAGSTNELIKLKTESPANQKFNKDNFDLITWFIISKQ